MEIGYDLPDDVTEAIDRSEALVFGVGQRRVTTSPSTLRQILERQLDHLEVLAERGQEVTGLPTGYVDLDRRLSGLHPANLVVVGARPSMGKSQLALGMAAHAAAVAGAKVLIFSLEMSEEELGQRLLAAEAGVDSTRLRNGQLRDSDWPRLTGAIERLAGAGSPSTTTRT